MTLREVAEITLTASRMSRSHGRTFGLDPDKMRAQGFTPRDLERVADCVRNIEQYVENELFALEAP